MATSVEVRQATEQELVQEFAHKGFITLPPGVLVFAVEGPFFFGAVENFERALAGTHTDPQHLIIRLKWVPFIDITGLQTLEEVINDLQKRGVNVMLSGANDRVRGKLQKSGIIDLIGEKNNFHTFDEALAYLKESMHELSDASSSHKTVVSDFTQNVRNID
ncbi:transporter [Legionella sainthelensi]|nr:sodium-independent anion transporter [Legionella sainthelensi]VEB37836.1 transporter [Legionella sainthelensi]